MLKRVIIIGMLLLTSILITSCREEKEEYAFNYVVVEVKADYRSNFENKEITVESFNWDNIQTIEYSSWNENRNVGKIYVYLKRIGEEEANEVVNHFKTLNFVSSVKKDKQGDYSLDQVIVVIKDEYRSQFETQEITKESLGWDNIKNIKYQTWSGTYNVIVVFFNNFGKQEVFDAINHFNTLDFVEYVTPNYVW